MIDVSRIIEGQSRETLRKVTDTQQEFYYLEELVESTKPAPIQTDHHYLIWTQFRYPIPVPPEYAARFKPPHYHKNSSYVSEVFETSLYEYTYHWLEERVHCKNLSSESQQRTGIFLNFDTTDCLDISYRKDINKIMSRTSYAASHDFVLKLKKDVPSIKYPSCRDPLRRMNYVIYDILKIGKKLKHNKQINLSYYDNPKKCVVKSFEDDINLEILWESVK